MKTCLGFYNGLVVKVNKMEDLLYKIGLTLIPKVGPVNAKNLVSYCGGVREVFESTKKELMKVPGIGKEIARIISEQQVLEQAEKEVAFLKENGVVPMFYLDKNYPSRLKHFPDSPALLYYKGNAELNTQRVVAIVGTRQPTPRGVRICQDLVEGLSAYDVTIISGLAYGIDVTAHRQCLQSKIPTIGVLGHGLGHIYPFQHKDVAFQMLENGGLISEFSSEMGPDREHFPMRNRIIAGMSDALLVVETAKKGGSMISAYLANDYNKDVFAVPGRLGDKFSEGCNFLIKTHKAALIQSAEDVAYVMGWDEKEHPGAIQRELFPELTNEEERIIGLLRHAEEMEIDRLSFESKMSNSRLAALLLELEFRGLIKVLPGKRYMSCI